MSAGRRKGGVLPQRAGVAGEVEGEAVGGGGALRRLQVGQTFSLDDGLVADPVSGAEDAEAHPWGARLDDEGLHPPGVGDAAQEGGRAGVDVAPDDGLEGQSVDGARLAVVVGVGGAAAREHRPDAAALAERADAEGRAVGGRGEEVDAHPPEHPVDGGHRHGDHLPEVEGGPRLRGGLGGRDRGRGHRDAAGARGRGGRGRASRPVGAPLGPRGRRRAEGERRGEGEGDRGADGHSGLDLHGPRWTADGSAPERACVAYTTRRVLRRRG